MRGLLHIIELVESMFSNLDQNLYYKKLNGITTNILLLKKNAFKASFIKDKTNKIFKVE